MVCRPIEGKAEVTLTPGTRLGPYEIVAPLGAGGMGEVYRARDTRLGREVAVKVLPQHLSADAELRARFEREAKTISSLNHPHICTLFDVGREGDTDFLVMELVEGETLAERLTKGAMPTAEVMRLGGQIADALDRAHRAGVIHRDLKPGNVMLAKSGAKLMDFGLARATGMAGPGGTSGVTLAALTQSPTVAQALTTEGTLIGTFQYMSPEQLEGREADARSDLWALGCVLHEMVTSERTFSGSSQASLISSIMKDTPRPLSEAAPLSPPALGRLTAACLAKDPEERLQTAHDVRLQLSWIAEAGSLAGVPAPVAVSRKRREWLAWSLASVAIVSTLILGVRAILTAREAPSAVQSVIEVPESANLSDYSGNVILSPDGQHLAIAASDSAGAAALWIRSLAATDAVRVPGTGAAWYPFWSSDSRFVVYFDPASKTLNKVAVVGGAPIAIADAPNGRGGAWSADGTILFAPSSSGAIMRVSPSGGDVSSATALDSARGQTAHRFPSFLPGGRHFLFSAMPGHAKGWDIFVGSLGSLESKRLMTAQSTPVYAHPGYLVFRRDGRVVAQRFDAGRLELQGEPVPITTAPPRSDLDGDPVASVSENGRMAVLRMQPPDVRLKMLDASGQVRVDFHLPIAPWTVECISPDESRAVLSRERELWVADLARSVPMRFTTEAGSEATAAWSPDGEQIAFVKQVDGREEVHVAGLDGVSRRLPASDDPYHLVNDWSPDGRFLVVQSLSATTGWNLWLSPIGAGDVAIPYARGDYWELNGKVSPDSRWMAYVSDETGRFEVYVQSFPTPGRKVRITIEGGAAPHWSRDGRELLYFGGAGLMSVSVDGTGETFRPGTPRPVRRTPVTASSGAYSIKSGGWLVAIPVGSRPAAIRLIQNWQSLVR